MLEDHFSKTGEEPVAFDSRYFSKAFFPEPKPGQHWTEARVEQLAAIETRAAERRALKALVRQYHIKDNSPVGVSSPERGVRRPLMSKNNSRGPRQGTALEFPHLIPARPYCADFYGAGLLIRPRAEALRRRHVQINGPKAVDWLIFDIDRENAYSAADDANLPEPTVVSINPENGHGHLAYLLKAPVLRFDSSNRRPIEYLADIQRGFVRRLGADRAYGGLLAKNPLHRDWRSEWKSCRPYTLEDLNCELAPSDKIVEPRFEQEIGEGRNVIAFNDLRRVGYREALAFFENPVGFRARMADLGFALNRQFDTPMSDLEVKGIVKSVSKWILRHFSKEQFSAIQRRRVQRRWAGHVAAETIKPWQAAGISRATWYRRKRAETEGAQHFNSLIRPPDLQGEHSTLPSTSCVPPSSI